MANDKFIMFGLDDERSKDIAEVLGNATCKKILDYLADVKEASEKDISDGLSIPINTVEYNLNKLVKTGLVDKSKNFFWSTKGRKIDMFKLAKKHIIISPKQKRVDMKALKNILPVILAAIVIILIALAIVPYFNKQIISIHSNINNSDFKQFNSYEELRGFINNTNQARDLSYETFSSNVKSAPNVAPSAAQTGVAAGASNGAMKSSSDSSASSYSHTNNQVEGVDEADIVKNDGKYIYTLSGNKLVIVNAYPAEQMKKIAEINFTNARNLFINKDKLIVFEDGYINTYPAGVDSKVRCLGYGCYGNSEPYTNVYVYNIQDRTEPKLENNFSFVGNYQESRMIGDYVYVISSKYVGSDNPEPVYYANGVSKSIPISSIYYSPYVDSSYIFESINAISLNDGSVNNKMYLVGGTGTVYVSQNNIYLSYQKSYDYNDYNKRKIEVYLEIAPDNLKEKINEIINSNDYYFTKESRVVNLIYNYSMSLTGESKNQFDSNLQKSLNDFEKNLEKERDKTIINRVNVDKLDINYESNGEVPGHLLNQFSMDEYDNNLRVASTVGEVWNGNSVNNVYVLDKNLNIIGKLENLANGEKIYSARFLEKRAYIVTFKKVDPLFVIDLSDATNPKVLGYLKIPGYSDYLHPYDENHVIGIGKDAIDASDSQKSSRNLDFAWYQGVKVSLFDVSDVENPKEVGKVVIGDRGTDSPALYDHKALLFDKEKNILVLPISLAIIDKSKYHVCNDSQANNYNYNNYCLNTNTYGEEVWQGAYVLNIDLQNGISVRGNITHLDTKQPIIYGYAKDDAIGINRTDESGIIWTKISNNGLGVWQGPVYYNSIRTDADVDQFPGGVNYKPNIYDYRYQIQRSLFMDNVLYTISQSKIKANDLTSIDEINSLDLGYNQNNYYGEGIAY